MALKTLILERFRGKSRLEIPFGQKNWITGRNGAGKTTLREGICFAFTGTDSLGNRKPRHLISYGEEDTKVTVVTDKVSIVRTLTSKGNGTLKLVRNGVPTTLTQTQLESMLGSTDLFLSAFIPGYFLELPVAKQHEVLAEVQPKLDRMGLLESLLGFALTSEERIRYNPANRRPEIVASYVAQDRREVDRSIDTLRGEQEALVNLEVPPKPQEPAEKARLGLLSSLKAQWDRYTQDLDKAQEQEAQTARIRERNAERAKRRKAMEAELALLKEAALPKDPGFDANFEYLRAQLKTPPPKPALGTVVHTENCPTCGQTVGLKHREKVKAKNEEVMAAWENAEKEVAAFNQKIRDQIQEVQNNQKSFKAEYSKIEEENRKVRGRKQAISLELERLRDESAPESSFGLKVDAPEEVYNPEVYAQCEQVVAEYNRKVTEHEYALRQKNKSESRVIEIQQNMVNLGTQSARLFQIEKALKDLPGEEMKLQSGAFEVEGLEIRMGEQIEVLVGTTPYALLSTGQRMKADVLVGLKIGSLMKPPVQMVFLDNADLVDEVPFPDGIQWFAAKVVPNQDQVLVEMS